MSVSPNSTNSAAVASVEQLNACFDLLARGASSFDQLASASGLPVAELESWIRPLIEQDVLSESSSNATAGASVLQFSSNLERLSSSTIKQFLTTRAQSLLCGLEMHHSIGSTNDHLLSVSLNPGQAAACLAEMQLAGRGRRGNAWHSGSFRNIAMSLGYKLTSWPQGTPSFALAAAVAIASVLRASMGVDVKIKWPNDLLVNDRKLGGILVEAAGAYGGDCLLVVGLGLNLIQKDDSVLAGSEYQWTSLSDLDVDYSRNELVAELIDALLETFKIFEQSGFEPFVEHWQALSAFHDQLVRVTSEAGAFEGWQRGVDSTGGLLVEDVGGVLHRIDEISTSVRKVYE